MWPLRSSCLLDATKLTSVADEGMEAVTESNSTDDVPAYFGAYRIRTVASIFPLQHRPLQPIKPIRVAATRPKRLCSRITCCNKYITSLLQL